MSPKSHLNSFLKWREWPKVRFYFRFQASQCQKGHLAESGEVLGGPFRMSMRRGPSQQPSQDVNN